MHGGVDPMSKLAYRSRLDFFTRVAPSEQQAGPKDVNDIMVKHHALRLRVSLSESIGIKVLFRIY